MKKRSIFKNYLFSVAYSVMKIFFPLIIMPYVSRILLPGGLGRVSYAQNIASYFILIASLGIPNYGIREIAKNGENVQDRSQSFFEIFRINLVSTLCATFIYYFLVFRTEYFVERRLIYCIVGISLIFNAFNIDWFYKGLEEFKYITIRSYIVKVISLIAIFLFIQSNDDVNKYALLLTLATSANYVFNIIYAKKYLVYPKCTLNYKRHIKPIFFLFAAVLVELYAQLDITMLGTICGETYVGYYINVIKVIQIVTIVITSIGSVLLPRFSVFYHERRTEELKKTVEKTVQYILFISIPCAVGVLFESEAVVRILFGEAFLPAVATMRILSPLIPIFAVGNIFGTQLLMALNQEKKLTMTVLIGAIVNIMLNFLLIGRFQQNGAAAASVTAELAVMIAQICFACQYVKVSTDYKLLNKIMIQAGIMAIVLILVNRLWLPWIIKLIVSVGSGAITYMLSGLVLKNEILFEILSICKNIRSRRMTS